MVWWCLIVHVYVRRNLEYYDSCHYDTVQSVDSDSGASAGELVIKIPKSAYDSLGPFGESLIVCSKLFTLYCMYVYVCYYS